MIKSLNQFVVYQKSMDLVVLIYGLTEEFPNKEIYCLTTQMRRCAISIPSNISEGWRRRSPGDFQRFLRIAFGSASELETQLEITRRLNYGDREKIKKSQDLLEEVLKMLNKMTCQN